MIARVLAMIGLTACSRLAGIGNEFRAADADMRDSEEDARVDVDANTMGWPTNGGVGPRTCTVTADEDGDTRVDDCDNCPLDANSTQDDRDTDGIGDVCDPHPGYAVERLAYFSGFNGTLAAEGEKIGSSGTFAVQGGLLRQTATTVPRTLFVLAGGPWRRPTIELKIASVQLNGTNPDYYAGLYLLQDAGTAAPEPRPDSISCSARWGANPRLKLIRLRGGAETLVATSAFTVAANHTALCAAEHLGEAPACDGNGGDVAPSALTNRITIDPDASDAEQVSVGVWTYYSRADFSGVAVYDMTYP